MKREQEYVLRGKIYFLFRFTDPLNQIALRTREVFELLSRARHAGRNLGGRNARNTCFKGTREAIFQDINASIEYLDQYSADILAERVGGDRKIYDHANDSRRHR